MDVIIENNLLKVKSEYNEAWISKAKELHGIWSSPYWIFDLDREKYVRAALMDVYGEDGLPCHYVIITIALDEYPYSQELKLGDVVIAKRANREGPVRLFYDAIVIHGRFKEKGGTLKYPRITAEEGTILQVKISETLYHRVENLPGIKKIGNPAAARLAYLEEEKTRLMARIAEIEQEKAQIIDSHNNQ